MSTNNSTNQNKTPEPEPVPTWCSINKFVVYIMAQFLEADIATDINVNLKTVKNGAYNNASIIPIGYGTIVDGKPQKLSYYDVHAAAPELKYIQFKNSGTHNLSKCDPDVEAYKKLVISTALKKAKVASGDTIQYHESAIMEVKSEPMQTYLLKNYNTDVEILTPFAKTPKIELEDLLFEEKK